MRTDTAGPSLTSESLEGLVREKVHELIQEILEEEVTVLLTRVTPELKAALASGPTAAAAHMAPTLQSKSIPGQKAESASA